MKDFGRHIELLICRYLFLKEAKQNIVFSIRECYETKYKILITGNGGSAADA